jgi:glycosyltransferase involved in cell wall biosynthesis
VFTTVVIPTYNRRVMVREAIDSVLRQRSVDFELIVVDDGSTDGTAAELEQDYGDRIRLLRTDNHGVAAARNLGVRAGRGELVALLDSDDLWLEDKLATQVAFFEGSPSAAICQVEEIWYRNGRRVNPCNHHRKPDGAIFERSLDLCLVSPSAVMMRRGLFERAGGFDESLPACEDYDLWLRIAIDNPVRLLPQPLVIKRGGHDDQLSRRFWGMDRFRVASISRLLASDRFDPARRAAAVSALKRKCDILAKGAARRGRQDEAMRYLRLADVHG